MDLNFLYSCGKIRFFCVKCTKKLTQPVEGHLISEKVRCWSELGPNYVYASLVWFYFFLVYLAALHYVKMKTTLRDGET